MFTYMEGCSLIPTTSRKDALLSSLHLTGWRIIPLHLYVPTSSQYRAISPGACPLSQRYKAEENLLTAEVSLPKVETKGNNSYKLKSERSATILTTAYSEVLKIITITLVCNTANWKEILLCFGVSRPLYYLCSVISFWPTVAHCYTCMDMAGLEKPWFCAQFLCNHIGMRQSHTEAASPIKVHATCSVAVVPQGERSNQGCLFTWGFPQCTRRRQPEAKQLPQNRLSGAHSLRKCCLKLVAIRTLTKKKRGKAGRKFFLLSLDIETLAKIKFAILVAYHSKRVPQIRSHYAFEKKALEGLTQQHYDARGT